MLELMVNNHKLWTAIVKKFHLILMKVLVLNEKNSPALDWNIKEGLINVDIIVRVQGEYSPALDWNIKQRYLGVSFRVGICEFLINFFQFWGVFFWKTKNRFI